LDALASGQTPAVILRGIYPSGHCAALVERFYAKSLLYDPRKAGDGAARRVDIGTSLGTHSADPAKFFAHAAQTHALFETLFDGCQDPVRTIYDALNRLAPGKKVLTAQEPDGRRYGPAIFRTYHAGVGHSPHFDSVAKRSKLFNYAVSRFQKQFAGVLCFQNSDDGGESRDAYIYNAPWTPALQERLAAKTFHQYAAEQGILPAQVHLEPGDLYFFFTENIHEVPPVVGDRPRIVLAVFIGLSPDDGEIFVWS
jgi:hypothetical protein